MPKLKIFSKSIFSISNIIIIVLLTLFLFLIPTNCVTCSQNCQTCYSSSSFQCTTCKNNNNSITNPSLYLYSCQYFSTKNPLFVIFCIFIVLINIFMLMMGFGVYQSIYQKIQLTSLLLWIQSSNDNKIITLQGTNFAIQTSNSFIKTFGVQFIILLFIMLVFGILILSYSRIVHNPIAILINRKRIIFPTRIVNLTINIILFSSLASISTTNTAKIDIFQLMLSVIAIGFGIIMYLSLFYICNFKKFKLDDPNYYVICQKIISTKIWIKNKLFIQATINNIMIFVFVLGFSNSKQSSIVLIVFQALYLLYIVIFVPWVKIRYKIFNILGTGIFLAILITLNGQINASINKDKSKQQLCYQIYYIMIILLCITFMISNIIQIIILRDQFGRQLRSFKNRFILCQKIDQKVQLTKYDINQNRQKVVQFQNNQIYGMDLTDIRRKLTNIKDQIRYQSVNNYNTNINKNNNSL